jgi:predicted enzyme related to lactoylglutathione lyase
MVSETFFSVEVADMARATAFYVAALGAEVVFASPGWSSLRIAGVRVGLALTGRREPTRVGLHFVVADLASACDRVARAGGQVAGAPVEVAPGVVMADVADGEGNTFTLNQR